MKPWPKVLENDDGIRPAGRPDECFYCQQKVGSPHMADCVTISQLVEYQVEANGTPVGRYTRHEPYHWTSEDCYFRLNNSSWCASNALDQIVWDNSPVAKQVQEETQHLACCCDLLTFSFLRVLDEGPLQEIRHA